MRPTRLLSSTAASVVEVDHLVIGSGVVGLAVAQRLSASKPAAQTLLVDRWPHFGAETSSRNSEVIHAGIYYPDDSLKTRLCIRGRELLYTTCKQQRIPHSNVGKWIVAVSASQAEELERLHRKAAGLGVHTHFIAQSLASEMEPAVKAHSVLVSSTTGIIDSHAFMQYLENSFVAQGGIAGYNSTVTSLARDASGRYTATIRSPDGQTSTVVAASVVNAAGLASSSIASMLLPPHLTSHLKMHFCKGHYFSYRPAGRLVSRLIYPMPEKNLAGLGIHCTIDLAGRAKFGPDTLYVDSPTDYSLDAEDGSLLDKFHRAVSTYMPTVKRSDLQPDYTGIRPKLAGPGEPSRDFVIEVPAGYGGFVNLVGIESPGLTSSLAIAERVMELLGYTEPAAQHM
ncbi:FAD dependent oxidoreductase [Entophlyctis helioformis]|nr:FAD dependent oxidoreductase [Entophlyctis helioformis]